MNSEDLAFVPAWQLRDMIASKEVSPVELVDLYLRRIERINPQLNAYLTIVEDLARSEAKKAEEGGLPWRNPGTASRHAHCHQGPGGRPRASGPRWVR